MSLRFFVARFDGEASSVTTAARLRTSGDSVAAAGEDDATGEKANFACRLRGAGRVGAARFGGIFGDDGYYQQYYQHNEIIVLESRVIQDTEVACCGRILG